MSYPVTYPVPGPPPNSTNSRGYPGAYPGAATTYRTQALPTGCMPYPTGPNALYLQRCGRYRVLYRVAHSPDTHYVEFSAQNLSCLHPPKKSTPLKGRQLTRRFRQNLPNLPCTGRRAPSQAHTEAAAARRSGRLAQMHRWHPRGRPARPLYVPCDPDRVQNPAQRVLCHKRNFRKKILYGKNGPKMRRPFPRDPAAARRRDQ